MGRAARQDEEPKKKKNTKKYIDLPSSSEI
jgi:hypothetical protein